MNLIMFDIDGTITQSYEYDQEIFARAVSEVTGMPFNDTDWQSYSYITSSGVTPEGIFRATGKPATQEQVKEVERILLSFLEQRYLENPTEFKEVPGASVFLSLIRNLGNTAISIATGCWYSEALFKLKASSVNIDGIPLATCDDSKLREEIMEISARRACEAYHVSHFDHIVFLGDGIWDLYTARLLRYHFIGIGSRIHALREAGAKWLHKDYSKPKEIISSIIKAINK